MNGLDIQHLRRSHRTGFKGGALQEALASTRGEMVAIFDADFIPPPDFLQRTIPHFVDNPALGVLQTRWGHLNPENSALTAAQAIALDKHFSIDQKVRFQANLFPKFNGTAGIWRRRTMEDAGGWEHDTVTEDLDLSTRAVLKGWSFRFLDDVVTAAELPVTMAAFKNQQARWAKGSTQCLLKYGSAILSDRKQKWVARLYALLTMSAYCAQLLLILLLLLALPLVYFDIRLSPLLLLFVIAGIGQPLLFTISQKVLYDNWQSKLRHLPTLLLVAVGLAPSISRAIIQAIFSSRNNFVRTPKGLALAERSGYQLPFDWIILCELALSIYALAGVFLALQRGNIGPLFFLLTCAGGMGYVAVSSLLELWRPFHRARSARSSKQPA
jgi:cellulose synthase/poly-beta-1,6-N-acetylglucosamine synthase-like glycosyltransferase